MPTRDIYKISFHYLTPPFFFQNRRELKRFLLKQLEKEGKKVDAINFIFCSDAYLLEINKQYLNHDTLTDIITFELSPNGHPLLADIYISIERVKENAKFYGIPFKTEFHRVVFHGILHLLGFKDKLKTQAAEMRTLETSWLNEYIVPREKRDLKD